ncbi:septal ring lytic transglycosylase RlpA family protein [Solimonas terrae]|uniref:Endolytic peptidoglycan transglycosylase RlpA n=1 Tax=Solimonas terrae TaxID=1396819 RepID=A0A6M2BWF9_9GAMM|nr:septal ring lytic transglycosylase RlpA family protein [Solimonas terrae]NGY06724.1 septal ring lytic transglycosylase RlpA family protein [Solimonas terrae]
MMRARAALSGCLALALSACAVGPPIQSTPTRTVPVDGGTPAPRSGTRPRVTITQPDISDSAPDRGDIPADVANTPDAVPRVEPRSASGNPEEYEAFGTIYHVLDDTAGFKERGRASWYGKKFQGRKTASGEPYDMFAMTAAHKTLPIPSYVRVTNLENGKTAVVRINDRGPFHSGRIIDLSYAAAARLGVIANGHAEVEIVALQPNDDSQSLASATPPSPPPAPTASDVPLPSTPAVVPTPTPGRWLQVAAYTDPINALAMRDELLHRGLAGVIVSESPGGQLHRVMVGPFGSDKDAQDMRQRLHDAGYPAFWVKN